MTKYLKHLALCLVFIGNSVAVAGSYEDFFTAIKRDTPSVTQDLLQRGFDANTPDPQGRRGLTLAILEPAPKVAAVLIAWPKTDLNARKDKDENALMLAALKGQDEMVAALIARGAYVNKPGWAPLHYAATNGHVKIMARLIEAYAFIDAESPNGTTPLMMAAHYGSSDAVRLLIAEGADPLMKNQLGLTAVDFARRANRTEAAELIAAAVRAKRPKATW